MTQNQPLHVAIIGGGFMGRVHAQAARSAGAHIVGISSSSLASAERAAAAYGIGKAFATAEELIADPSVQVVHICTPNATHADLAHKAIAAGKHVICEKPLAVSSAESESLVNAVTAANLVGAVPFVYRFHPMVREARARVANGETGRIISVRGSYLQDWLLEAGDDNWRVSSSEGGASRAFADIGSHLVDLMEFVLGDRIASLNALTNIAHASRAGHSVDTEDEAVLIFKSVNGVVGTLMVSQVAAGRKNRLQLDVAGTNQSIEFNQETPESIWLGRRSGSITLPRDESLNGPEANRLSTVPSGHPMGYVDAFAGFVRDVYSAVRGESIDGLPLFADGHRSSKVIEAVLQSASTGQWVNL